MMTVKEMKEVLTNKFEDEGCCFKKSDITIHKTKKGYEVIIKDYEHIPFDVVLVHDEDEYFPYIVMVNARDWERGIAFTDGKHDYDLRRAMIELGYYVATRF